MSETVNIGEIANRVSNDIIKWFKWEKLGLMDEDFPCHKQEKHKVSPTRNCLTHPVDVVFSYFDPYLNKTILLNTDLKSYKKASISKTSIRKGIKSLANTVDCAKGSPEWKSKYTLEGNSYEVRGMLFVYNNDNEYDNEFFKQFEGIRLENLVDAKNTIIHILEPKRIRYLFNVITDMKSLYADDAFPKDDYSFYYPDLHLHKTNGNRDTYAASIELLTSPYMIISHGDFKIDENGTLVTKYEKGYLIYYNREGSTHEEFMYLFDTLSRFQMLNENIRIRVAHDNTHDNIQINYENAIKSYLTAWGADAHKENQLRQIDFQTLNTVIQNYNPAEIGWRGSNE